jgi:hypothetical protein
MKIRRVITGIDATGKSLWSTDANPSIPKNFVDPVAAVRSIVPGPGGTQFMIVAFPPDAVMMSASFDPAAAGAESLKAAPGLAERFELDNPGMHTTDTIDYGVVLEGEIWLELDDGQTQHLRKHDVIVQNGTRHAWRNRGNAVALVAFVLVGAKRAA